MLQMMNAELKRICPTGLPRLGSSSEQYEVRLSEQELHAIWAAVAFLKSERETLQRIAGDGSRDAWWEHYGPVLEHLSRRLQIFDDGTISEEV